MSPLGPGIAVSLLDIKESIDGITGHYTVLMFAYISADKDNT